MWDGTTWLTWGNWVRWEIKITWSLRCKGNTQYLCFWEPPTFATRSLHGADAFLAFKVFSAFYSKAKTPNSWVWWVWNNNNMIYTVRIVTSFLQVWRILFPFEIATILVILWLHGLIQFDPYNQKVVRLYNQYCKNIRTSLLTFFLYVFPVIKQSRIEYENQHSQKQCIKTNSNISSYNKIRHLCSPSLKHPFPLWNCHHPCHFLTS